MKTRNGFVSNSSSASFVVRWKLSERSILEDADKIDLFDEAFCLLFDVGHDDNFVPNFTIWSDLKSTYDVLKKRTAINGEVLETSFFTSMLNTIQDFGEAASYFNFALDFPPYKNIIVIEKTIDRDDDCY